MKFLKKISGLMILLVFLPQTVLAGVGVNPKDYRSLDNKMLGHIRHVVRMAEQPDGEWRWFGTYEPGQEGDSSIRYQLAFNVYALSMANYHYTPAYRELYKRSIDQQIHKMQRREVWGYWEDTSKGAPYVDPDFKEFRQGWNDPVVKENIMYSGHLFAMVGLYSMLFNDDKYFKDDSIVFDWSPVFRAWPQRTQYKYSYPKLAKIIYDQFKENGWKGIVCEPNGIFIVCNEHTFPGFKFIDLLTGTKYEPEVTKNFKAYWDKRGFTDKDGHYIQAYFVKQDQVWFLPDSHLEGWTGSFMNFWYPELAQKNYPIVKKAFVKWLGDNLAYCEPGPSADWLVASGSDQAHMASYAAEMSDKKTANAMVAYADKYFKPKWEDGAYYYPRNETQMKDKNGLNVHVTAITGNELIAYARLNPGNGFRTIYNQPFTKEHFEQPFIDQVNYPNVLVRQAIYDSKKKALVLTFTPGDKRGKTSFRVNQLNSGKNWEIYRNGALIAKINNGVVKSTNGANALVEAYKGTAGSQLKITHPLNSDVSFVFKQV